MGLLQVKLPQGRTPDNWYNIKRDLGHNWVPLLRQAVLSVADDAITPRPSEDELKAFCASIGDTVERIELGTITEEELQTQLAQWPKDLMRAVGVELVQVMFRHYREWRIELLPQRPIVPPPAPPAPVPGPSFEDGV